MQPEASTPITTGPAILAVLDGLDCSNNCFGASFSFCAVIPNKVVMAWNNNDYIVVVENDTVEVCVRNDENTRFEMKQCR